MDERTSLGSTMFAGSSVSFSSAKPGKGGLILSPKSSVPRTFKPPKVFQDIYDNMDSEDAEERCKRYGFTYESSPKRRIFFGALIADEPLDAARLHAAEAYDLYHTVAFVESNATFINTPRDIRYLPGTAANKELSSGIFGKNADVFVDFWYEAPHEKDAMVREGVQRHMIGQRWKAQGMRRDDIGIVADLDELFTRDFMLALQSCDYPPLMKEKKCKAPKYAANTLNFEALPSCMSMKRLNHPDLMMGECTEGIGDPTDRVVALREFKREFGNREIAFGLHPKRSGPLYSDVLKKFERYPLWGTQDYREILGTIPLNVGEKFTAFHLHNFFDDMKTVRHKYATYGHGTGEIENVTLSRISASLDLTVRCVHGLGNYGVDNPRHRQRTLREPSPDLPVPVYFQDESYVKRRFEQVRDFVLEDEQIYGSGYEEVLRQQGKAS
eukprot:CAMPEP_0116541480 /NCGR_PEP_ID=MMETSP0397-20121206/505_1 /TAXON_ID=216820 /ORGANISM="Cyclophora tenuis, Strain ECT3854" /LENGTH=440 /DNA_ID=CAMNT_0004065425 /DNA_START=79 /DNA_END=1401 /DNA_ORIENTATION=+